VSSRPAASGYKFFAISVLPDGIARGANLAPGAAQMSRPLERRELPSMPQVTSLVFEP